ncbi:MAG: AbrB/MazE/SpoVT family DNA-binding domain-containing protein [Candidatus Methanodesulfokora sp.]|jgi:bifunctional DNA-binding transcriptional regulator/antitoxin component of YhaV-PrlF toxin-antitoxin module
MEVMLRIRKKGVLILPKSLREAAGIEEGEVLAEARDGVIVLRPFRLREVEVDQRIVDKLLREEEELERRKVNAILREIRG